MKPIVSITQLLISLHMTYTESIIVVIQIHNVCLQPPPARYGGRHTVALIPGDGIGPELLNHVRELFRSVFFVFLHIKLKSFRFLKLKEANILHSHPQHIVFVFFCVFLNIYMPGSAVFLLTLRL